MSDHSVIVIDDSSSSSPEVISINSTSTQCSHNASNASRNDRYPTSRRTTRQCKLEQSDSSATSQADSSSESQISGESDTAISRPIYAKPLDSISPHTLSPTSRKRPRPVHQKYSSPRHTHQADSSVSSLDMPTRKQRAHRHSDFDRQAGSSSESRESSDQDNVGGDTSSGGSKSTDDGSDEPSEFEPGTPPPKRKKLKKCPPRSQPHSKKERCPICFDSFLASTLDHHMDNCRNKQTTPMPTSVKVPYQIVRATTVCKEEPAAESGQSRSSSRKSQRLENKHTTTPVGSDSSEDEVAGQGTSPGGHSSIHADWDSEWRLQVEDALRTARKERMDARDDALKKALDDKNRMLQDCTERRKSYRHLQCLPDTRQTLGSEYVTHPDYPMPRDTHHTIFLRRHFSLLDGKGEAEEDDGQHSRTLPENDVIDICSSGDESTVPAFSPSKDHPIMGRISEFRTQDKIGVGYEVDEMQQEIDRVLKLVENSSQDRREIHRYLAFLLQERVELVQERYQKLNEDKPTRQLKTPYEEEMSSFRDLFCRRCLTFDCNLHGLTADYPPDLQTDLALRREKSGYWMNEGPPFCLPVGSLPSTPPTKSTTLEGLDNLELSEEQKIMCRKLYHVFGSDLRQVAKAMGIPLGVLSRQVSLEPFEPAAKVPSPSHDYRSKQIKSNTYNPSWIKRIVEADSHPMFTPCCHSEPCAADTCSCVQAGFFCTKACIWGASSRNFFRGCNCTAKCTAKNCPCFASGRECDPDLCKRCGTCTDAPNKPATIQPCRNDSIGMRRHVHLLVGKSQVRKAGWGLFTMHDLKKGDYVHEYLGELIPHDEAERRGKIYDERNQTYLFDMSTDYAVDALRKGNKTRFINHSDNPNLIPQMRVVNGDYRIGFFAKKDISAQTELFFDYGKMFFKSEGRFDNRPPVRSTHDYVD